MDWLKQLSGYRLFWQWFVVLLNVPAEAGTIDEIIYWNRNDRPYYHVLLTLILDQTIEKYGPYRLVPSMPLEMGRALIELENNQLLNIMNVGTTRERETRFLPVRIPINKGLIGLRVMLIRAGEQARFEGIENLDDWRAKKLMVGQGTHWMQTGILEANDILVVKNPKYQQLFDMLELDRFDCISRSVSEIMFEFDTFRQQNRPFAIEQELLLITPVPEYHFVNRQNPHLAQRIQEGFEAVIDSGEFAELFAREYGETLRALALNKRTVIYLRSPFLSVETRAILNNSRYIHLPMLPPASQ